MVQLLLSFYSINQYYDNVIVWWINTPPVMIRRPEFESETARSQLVTRYFFFDLFGPHLDGYLTREIITAYHIMSGWCNFVLDIDKLALATLDLNAICHLMVHIFLRI